MTRAHVKNLKLRLSDADAQSHARFRVEEALRLSGQDGGERLVILRKLDLGRIDQGLNERTSHVLRDMIANAVPAFSPGSTRANAVWFASPEVAKISLLEILLQGVEPLAWYWPKAVPELKHGAASARLILLVQLQRSPQGRIKLAQLVRRMVEDSTLPRLLQHISETDATHLVEIWPGKTSLALPIQKAVPRSSTTTFMQPDSASVAFVDIHLRAVAQQIANVANLSSLLSMPGHSAVRQWLCNCLVLAANPSLVEDAAYVKSVARELDVMLANMNADAELPPANLLQSPSRATPSISNDNQQTSPAPQLLSLEQRSTAAGLFYLLRPLRQMGYDAWMKQHPHEATRQHGLQLLRHIAIRQRISAADPVWGLLPPDTDSGVDTSPWRVALDRWLRKHCRLNLAKVIKRTGWLEWGEDHISVRFPLDGADLRLRRRGVDVDPGFVSWLGRSVRFTYADKT
jgi:hypothetical protein